MTSSEEVLIAAYQGKCSPGNVQDNLARMRTQMEEASKAGACLIVFPELYTTGYMLEPNLMRNLSETKDGPTFKQLSLWTKELNIAVLYGYPEIETTNDTPVYYNSAAFIASDGSLLGNYRKQHLWIYHETDVFSSGSENLIIDYKGIKMGILICYDVEFPEAVRCLTLEGVKLVLVPTALSGFDNRVARILVPARALENNVYVAYVNNVCEQNGKMFVGNSCIHGPSGDPVAMAGEKEDCLLLATIDSRECAKLHGEHLYLRERRAKLYNRLITN